MIYKSYSSIQIRNLQLEHEELIIGEDFCFVASSHDAKMFAFGKKDGKIIILKANQKRFVFSGHGKAVSSVAFSKDKRFIVSGWIER